MCAASVIMDHYTQSWTQRLWPIEGRPTPSQWEVREFKTLYERAQEYDRKNNQPDCELEEKKIALKKAAEQAGLEIDFI